VAERKPSAAALWKKRMNFRSAHVHLFKGKVGKVLMQFRKKTLAKLDEGHLQKSAGQLAPDIMQRGLADIIFSHLQFGEALANELETLTAEAGVIRDKWELEKRHIDAIRRLKGMIEDVKNEAERAERDADLQRAAKLTYGDLPAYEAELAAETAALDEVQKVHDESEATRILYEEKAKRVRSLLSAYYTSGAEDAPGRAGGRSAASIDSAAFDADAYISTLVRARLPRPLCLGTGLQRSREAPAAAQKDAARPAAQQIHVHVLGNPRARQRHAGAHTGARPGNSQASP
jgi:hypothetical protein